MDACSAAATVAAGLGGGAGQPVTFLTLLGRFVVMADADWAVRLSDLATRETIERDLRFQSLVKGMEVRSVPVVRNASPDELLGYVRAGVPFVDCDAASGWPAMGWTLDMFAERYGRTVVPVTFPRKAAQGRSFSACDRTRDFDLRSFILSFDELQSAAERQKAPPPYLRAWSFERAGCGALRDDYTPPVWAQDWFAKMKPADQQPHFRWLFVGPAGAQTPLHVDPCLTHAWLTQIVGRKRWLLVPPADVSKVVDSVGFADLNDPDEERFPDAGKAARFELTLEPGQTIFIPQGWAHQVSSLEHGVSVTHNFLPKENFPLVRLACLRHIMGGGGRAVEP